ncbi:ABC transporter substrate-binding protein [Marinobacterium rhizophilum]|uniref:ABC transporter substrate-binding protein n=1 Tax=Marinobacterium rhizophilum TaxID=420402 RepID=A0ABY5HMM2_9GAMM|nr:ABC transporter substrate-binding protein [Marinobacterium rhizophilum]UTW13662.1 ABC transporter substrate-binding protein [Marinobacterium rhizophilum]
MKPLLSSVLIAGALFASLADAGTLRIAHDVGYAGAESLDPISPSRFFDANQLLYSRLVRQGADGAPSAELATAWSASTDAKSWTFELRRGVKFHDGSDLTAADVKYTLERIKDPKIDSPVAAVLGVVDNVDVIDDYNLRINLTAPHADLPLLLMDYRVRIIPQDSGDDIATRGIGSGPFMLDELDPEGTTSLKAFSGYWEGAPAADGVELIGIPDSQARVQALMAGQLDLEQSITSQQARLFVNNPQFQSQSVATGEWRTLVFRTDTAPYNDARVRKALRMVVDRPEMMKLIAGEHGGTVTCDNPVWPGDQYRTQISCDADVEGAKALLAEAGYTDGIDITISSADNEPEFIRMIEVYQQQAAKAGIRVKLNMVPSDGYWSDVWMKDPAVASRWSQRPADQIMNEAFRSTAAWNESFYNNAEFDQLLDQARSELDFDKRKAHYAQLQQTLWQDGGALIPYHLNQTRVLRSAVSGVDPVEQFSIRWNKVAVD